MCRVKSKAKTLESYFLHEQVGAQSNIFAVTNLYWHHKGHSFLYLQHSFL